MPEVVPKSKQGGGYRVDGPRAVINTKFGPIDLKKVFRKWLNMSIYFCGDVLG